MNSALLRQSSRAQERGNENSVDIKETNQDDDDGMDAIDPNFRLMYMAGEGDVDGIKKLLAHGTDVNFWDIDRRTALHVAACQGCVDVAKLLLEHGADVDPKDRYGSTPLADAMRYRNHEVIKLLERYGAKHLVAPMHVQHARQVPEYEIDSRELDFTNSIEITKGTYRIALWRGTQVAVKVFWEGIADDDKVKAFRDELTLLQKIRHPNVVQFLGAVTQSSPMMIVTEYLQKGDLHIYLKRKGALKTETALRFALDIARGMNYLHEHKPEAIIHRDLEPSNILRDDSGILKVADFGVSKLLMVANRVKEDRPVTCQDTSCRYVAPEVFRNEEYDTKVDVFSFALILQEMIEGCPPFEFKKEHEVPKSYVANDRPPFRASANCYAHGLKKLIEECWDEDPSKRLTFKQIIPRLESIYNSLGGYKRLCWKVIPLCCFKGSNWTKDFSSSGSRTRSSRLPGNV